MSGPEGFVAMGHASGDSCVLAAEMRRTNERRPPDEAIAQAAALIDFQGRRQPISFFALMDGLGLAKNSFLRRHIKDGLLAMGYEYDGKYWWSK